MFLIFSTVPHTVVSYKINVQLRTSQAIIKYLQSVEKKLV